MENHFADGIIQWHLLPLPCFWHIKIVFNYCGYIKKNKDK
jgi:hypothetical protein